MRLSEDRLFLDIEKGIGDPPKLQKPRYQEVVSGGFFLLLDVFDVSNWIPSEGGENLKHGHLEPLSLSDPDAYRNRLPNIFRFTSRRSVT